MNSAENPLLVIEIGETIRIGRGGEPSPDICIPAQYDGRGLLPNSHGGYTLTSENEKYLSLLLLSAVKRIVGYEHEEYRLIQKTLCMLLIANYASEIFREQVARIVFQSLMCEGLFILSCPIGSAYSLGMTSAIVVDCGSKGTCVTPIFNGLTARLENCHISPVGGECFTDTVRDYISDERMMGNIEVPYESRSNWIKNQAEKIKEKHCYVPIGIPNNEKQNDEVIYLPDGQQFSLPYETVTCPGYLTDATLEGSVPHLMRSLVNNAIDEHQDPTPLLSDSVIVTGGVSLTRGLLPTLHKSLADAFPTHRIQKPVSHSSNEERRYSPWVGGSITSMFLPSELWVNRSEYGEEGRRVIHRKCPP